MTKRRNKVVKLSVEGSRPLTVGHVAVLCGVAHRTVTKWMDCGQLKSYRLPTSGERRPDRRVNAPDLFDYLDRHGLATEAVRRQLCSTAVSVGLEPEFSRAVRRKLAASGVELASTTTPFAAEVLIERHRPPVLVVDLVVGMDEARLIVVAARKAVGACMVVAIVGEELMGDVFDMGFDDAARRPVEAGDLAEWIARRFTR